MEFQTIDIPMYAMNVPSAWNTYYMFRQKLFFSTRLLKIKLRCEQSRGVGNIIARNICPCLIQANGNELYGNCFNTTYQSRNMGTLT